MTKRYAIALIALTLISGASLARVAQADDAAMEPIWKHYWMAVAAAGQCENRSFSGSEYDTITQVINGKVNNEIGPGPRTHLIDEAKSDVWDRVSKYGCQDQQVNELVALYHTELEPALH